MTKEFPVLTIVLSTYNGERYLREQIDSILDQTYKDWVLLIRDDGSADATNRIIDEYIARDPRIVRLNDLRGNLGPCRSFLELLSHVKTPYFMLCDQDDVWLPRKIEVTLAPLVADGVPQLVFTDLKVVDETLVETASSFMAYSRFNPIASKRLSKLIIQNTVVGCTVAGNQELLCAAKATDVHSLPSSIMMHDWWLALVACAFGKLIYVDQPTILYRQHGNNCLGARASGLRRYSQLLMEGRPWRKAQHYLNKVVNQAECFVICYSDGLRDEQKKTILRLLDIRIGYAPFKLLNCFFHGTSMHALDRNIALILTFLGGRFSSIWNRHK